MHRAFTKLEVKDVNDDTRVVRGVATSITADRMQDIVVPKGAKFKLPLPLLWQHNSREPVGHVNVAKVGDKSIEVEATIARTATVGRLRDRLDEAWESLKLKLVQGFSIGFNPLKYEAIEETFGYRFLEWEWLELSLVTIPANADATIDTIKSAFVKQRRVFVGPQMKNGGYVLAPHERKIEIRRRDDGAVLLR